MTNKELEEIIKEFEKISSEEDAYFGSSYNEDFGYAKGNRDGLILYAIEFLKAARDIDNRKFEEGDKEMYNPNFSWIKNPNANPFRYIQVTHKKRSEIAETEKLNKDTWKDKAIGIGCIAILIFGIFLIFVGLVYFIGWF